MPDWGYPAAMHSHSGLGRWWRRYKRKQGLSLVFVLALLVALALVALIIFLLSWRF